MTAAGDQMARLWDVKSGEMLGGFKGHLCSLKSVAFAPQEKGIVLCIYRPNTLYTVAGNYVLCNMKKNTV